jgi:hypothetical protein
MTRAITATAAAAGALFLGGCGQTAQQARSPSPALARKLANDLAKRSDAVADALAAGDSCHAARLAAELQRKTIEAINRGRVAPLLQEPLSASVNELVARVRCVPPAGKERDRGKHKKDKERD